MRKKLRESFVLTMLLLVVVSTIVVSVGVVDLKYASQFTTTDAGTPITNCIELQNIKNNLAGNYYLANDIDCSDTINWNSGAGFEPIGDHDNRFTGTFDGQGKTITDLYVDRPSTKYVGLFGCIGGGSKIGDVGLEGVNVGGYDDVGGLVGRNYGTVNNSYSTGSVNGGRLDVGGLVGENHGTVNNSYSTGSVNGVDDVGGLVGRNLGTVSNSYSTSSVGGTTSCAGGLVGMNDVTITKSYSNGSVNGNHAVGGLAGKSFGTISNSYSQGSVSGSRYVGGLVGYLYYSTITDCYSTGSVSSGTYIGGLVGFDYEGHGTVSNSFWDTQTSGQISSDGGTGKTTAEMKQQGTFDPPWDFVNVWAIVEDVTYPFFQWQSVPLLHVHNLDTHEDFATIQAAINDPDTTDEHTIFVGEGTYFEHVVVNKSLSLIGENRSTTIVDGNHVGTVMNITANNVNITGFTIQNSGTSGTEYDSGIHASSSGNNISHNIITNNGLYGTYLYLSSQNIITENHITNNENGIGLSGSNNNEFYHNNFINNIAQVYIHTSGYVNIWDDGYPSGGNFWSDYEDEYPNAEEIDYSGIWNTPYVIDLPDNVDRYPLMSPYLESMQVLMTENVKILDDGSCNLTIVMNVTSPRLSATYSRALGWDESQPDGINQTVPETIAFDSPKNLTFDESVEVDDDPGLIVVGEIPVKSAFCNATRDQQRLSLGINVTEFRWVNMCRVSGTFVIYVDALGEFLQIDESGNNWTVSIGPSNLNASTDRANFILTQIMFLQQMLGNFAGEQTYNSTWITNIVLPPIAEHTNCLELLGKNWTMNFGGGTYMKAIIGPCTTKSLVLTERMGVTEKEIEMTEPKQLVDNHFLCYKIFNIKYFLPGAGSSCCRTKATSCADDFKWGIDLTLAKLEQDLVRMKFSDTYTNETATVIIDVDMGVKFILKLKAHFDLKTKWLSLKRFRAWLQLEGSLIVNFDVSVNGTYDNDVWERHLFDWKAKRPYTFFVGPVPVEVTPYFNATAKLNVHIHGEVNVSFEANATGWLRTGVGWKKDNGFYPILDAGMEVTRDGPTLSSQLYVQITPSLVFTPTLLFYDIVGPSAEIQPYTKLHMGFSDGTFGWNLTAGLNINAGIRFSGWFKKITDLDDHYWNIFDWTFWTFPREEASVHDVAVSNLRVPTQTYINENLTVSVDVANVGDFNDTANVTFYYKKKDGGEWTPFGWNTSEPLTTVKNWTGSFTTLTFNYNTTQMTSGEYLISANATIMNYTDDNPSDNNRYNSTRLDERNVAVVEVTPLETEVNVGDKVDINVAVMNKGTTNVSTLPVFVYYEGKPISDVWCERAHWVFDLKDGTTETLTFTWDTKGVEPGEYTISAEADRLLYETNTTDNELANGTIKVIVIVETPVEILGQDYTVTTESNVILTDVTASLTTLSFYASGTTGETGYVNITLPLVLIGKKIEVFIDNVKITQDPTIAINISHYFVYFEFLLSTHDITIRYATGSWPMFHHNLHHTGYSTSKAPNTNNVLWKYGTGDSTFSSPAVADGKVFVGSRDGKVYCLNASTGDFIWSYTTGGWVDSSPTVADGKVYVGSYDNKVHCINATTGDYIWSYTTGHDVRSSPAVADGKVYVGSNDCKVYCLNASTGDFIWSYTTFNWVRSSPAVADGKVFVGSDTGKVYCINALTGEHIWSYLTGDSVWSSPAVADGKVYAGSMDGKVYCLNASTGDFIWSYTTGGWVDSSPTVADGKVYVGSYDNKVHCINATTGDYIWSYTTGHDVRSSPAVADGKVYVGSYDNKVHCINATTGDYIWSYTTGHDVRSSPAVADCAVYVGSFDNKVYAFADTYTLTITTTDGGTTSPSIGTHTHPERTSVSITAIPDTNYLLDHWELDGANVSSANPISVLMSSEHVLHAVFEYSPPACQVSPTNLNFGTVPVDSSKDLSFTITNTGGGTLTGTVSESCNHYDIVSGEGSYSLGHGQYQTVTVRFTPATAGTHICTISTGASCSDVDCTGLGEGFDFSVSASPASRTVTQGGSTTYTVTVTLTSGTPQTVSLSRSGCPSGATCTFSPSSGNPTFISTLTVSTSTSTPANTYTLTITGTGGGKAHSCTVVLSVITEQPVGGIWLPVDKLGLLAPYIGVASTIVAAMVAAAIYVKRVKRRKEKQ